MTKETIEYLDTDFLDNKIIVGDKVIFEAPKYRDFVIGTVISKAPKSCQIEYINNWNYSQGRKEVVRQGYCQVIKYTPSSTTNAKWIKKWHDNDLIGHMYEECPICGCMISDTEKFWDCKFCPNCGTAMEGKDSVLREEV